VEKIQLPACLAGGWSLFGKSTNIPGVISNGQLPVL
jgi:hypothetical protein